MGASVCVPIPEGDKGRGDLQNSLAIVVSGIEDRFYKLGTFNGLLKQVYTRSQFTVCPRPLMGVEDIPEQETALRSPATAQLSGSGQGFVKCV